jgi:hypothetical protein
MKRAHRELRDKWLARRYLNGEDMERQARIWRLSKKDMKRALRRGRDALKREAMARFAVEYEQNLDLARIDAMFPPPR